MVYNPNIPDPNDDPADDVYDMLSNFGVLNTQFAVNHLPLTNVTSQAGYHTKVFFPTGLVADPNLPAPETSIYTKLVTGVAQLFFQNGATGAEVRQLTGIAPTNVGTNYFLQTPFGIKLAYGTYTAAASSATVTFAGTFTSVTICLVTQIDSVGGSRASTVSALSNTGCIVHTSNSTSTGYYLALGT